MHRSLPLITSLIVMMITVTLHGQQPPSIESVKAQSKGETKVQATPKTKGDEAAKEKEKAKTSTDEEPVITHHRIHIDGKELAYTATAGLMPLRDAKGEVEARIFFVAYTQDDVSTMSERPLMFSFNGGPGSASVWLHLGALGPKRVDLADEPTIPVPPFHLVNNEATWLDRTDLVFIDPVGTGFSRAAKPELSSKFHALRGDITSVGEFIRMYLSRYDRWASPLYLIGESYGTTRAAGLAGYLVDQGIAFNGLVLVSCALDFQGFVFNPGNDVPFLTYLPAYTASAWYHKKLAPDLQQADLPVVLKEVEHWVDQEYASVLAHGDRLTVDERRAAAIKLARYTGLSASTIDVNNLRIEMSYFCKELLKQDRRSIGRLDARYQGIESSAASASPSFDPSLAAVRAPYTSTFNNYIHVELGYKTDVPYYILGEGVGRWDWQRDMGYPATTSDLRDAMTKNPHMKVLIASGYYDLATPYRAVEHALATQGFDPILRKNIMIEKYDAGHMMYVHGPSLHKLKQDGAALIDSAKGKR
jgi:carboxypeptidase C (cathepsin A)